ncbi:unnamed protein product [Anisakis simplex]|uniref:Ubiquinone biosynthesis protein COQ7 homolog (inferred by orthology to a C. elegans protein) n=1 Tax=Anisakis simplex TaxID=6269 RepID=A0A0M3J7N2_ANISI|nr:unnamed protein product [Anisakis simplex]
MRYSLIRLAQQQLNQTQLNSIRKKLIEKIVRVDHAGELGADRIYAGQMAVLSSGFIEVFLTSAFDTETSTSSVVQHMWDQEREHLRIMERLLHKHDVAHSIFSPVFSTFAYALGAGTALLGEKSAMACTVAVEELITQHYNNQIRELSEDDPEVHSDLIKLLKRLRDEEDEHRQTGVDHNGREVCKCSIAVSSSALKIA